MSILRGNVTGEPGMLLPKIGGFPALDSEKQTDSGGFRTDAVGFRAHVVWFRADAVRRRSNVVGQRADAGGRRADAVGRRAGAVGRRTNVVWRRACTASDGINCGRDSQGVALRALPWAILFHAFSVKR